MLESLFKKIPTVKIEFNLYHQVGDLDKDQILFSAYQFSKGEPVSNSYTEKFTYDDIEYVSGRHVYTDKYCIKGAGISKFYNSKKERKILGGLDWNSALKEYLLANILKKSQTCIEVLGLGSVLKDHYFIIRPLKWYRVAAGFNKSLNGEDQVTIKDYLFNIYPKPKELIQNYLKVFETLFYSGIVHTSYNEFNIDLLGRIIDVEGLFLIKSSTNLSFPITFLVDDLNATENKLLEICQKKREVNDFYIDYFDSFIQILNRVVLKNVNDIYQTKLLIEDLLEDYKLMKIYKKSINNSDCTLEIISSKIVRGKSLVYAEIISNEPVRNSINNLDYFRKLQKGLFDTSIQEERKKIIKGLEKVIVP